MMLARTPLPPRRGAILLVTLTLVALFAVVALSFALYGESQANASRMNREALAGTDEPPDAAAIASQFLGRVLYPVDPQDAATYGTTSDALLNAIRGYDMATMVYGYNPNGGNTVPYNGIGTVFEDLSSLGLGLNDRREVVNYSWQSGNRFFDPEHLGSRTAANTPPATTYVGRNAPYTYPDRNNLYVAVQDPITGRILKVSYVSSHFNGTPTTPPTTGDVIPPIDHRLAPPTSVSAGSSNGRPAASDDWLNTAGRYKTIRPRPADHILPTETAANSQFPYPSANPDGSFTGDVQNIPNTEGIQRNDAVWINAGLPVMKWRGRNIIPLIAPTILPLDGRVNANVAGNTKGTGNAHGSTHGFGPWEINLARVLNNNTGDAQQLIADRSTAASLNPRGTSVATHPFSQNITQAYGAVNWDAGAAAAIQMPTGNQSDPTYGAAGYDFATATGATTESAGHPGLFNPYSWGPYSKAGPNTGKLFSFPDLRRTTIKYSGRGDDYANPYFLPTAPASLTGFGPASPSNTSRALLTTISNSLARPGLQPNYPDYTTSTLTYQSGALTAVPQPLTTPFASVVSSDFATATTLRSATAVLGAVNVNRPVADYRAATNPTGALSPTNFANATQAAADRQLLARDVFARLIVATGAKANVNATTGVLQLPQPGGTAGTYDLVTAGDTTQQQYDALRYLAQLAANIVDYVDNDDVVTTFVWNPSASANLFAADAAQAEMQTYFTTNGTAAQQATREAYVRDRVAFGVERPRVLLNEVYAEITNAPSDSSMPSAMSDFHVRFWIEVCNPTNTGDAAAPLGDGTAALSYAGSSPYKVQVFKSGTDVRSSLFDPTAAIGNPTGRADALTSRVIDAPLPSTAQINLEPNNGAANTTGFRLLGPDLSGQTASSAKEFIPDTTAAPYTTNLVAVPNGAAPPAPGSVSNTLAYSEPRKQPSDLKATYFDGLGDHAVLLRRLANPYAAANDPLDASFNSSLPANPFVTVDVFTDVKAWDAIRVGSMEGIDGMRPKGGDAMKMATERKSRGRVAPNYAHRTPLTGDFVAETGKFVQEQAAAGGPDGQFWSFFNHNNPFLTSLPPTPPATPPSTVQWLTHLDRPAVNAIDLLHVAGVKNHELTYKFVGGTAGNPQPHLHTAPFTVGTTPLYRALELLTVKPWGYGLPAEGRVPGKINVNMIWNQSVVEALLDLNATTPSNNSFTTTDVTNFYGQFLFGTSPFARTKGTGGVPGTTTDEEAAPASPAPDLRDRPIKPFGVANFIPPTAPPTPPATVLLPNGSGLQDTLLRDVNPTAPSGTPAVFRPDVTGQPALHPYLKAEMLRKMYNNVTTTSDTYLVVMTVGYFEVRNNPAQFDTANPPVLGKELFNEVPGDLRKKFVAVIDRSMLAVVPDPNDTAAVKTKVVQADNLFHTDLTEKLTIAAGTTTVTFKMHANGGSGGEAQIFYEGRLIRVRAASASPPPPDEVSSLYIGTGRSAVKVGVTGVTFDTTTGVATVTATVQDADLSTVADDGVPTTADRTFDVGTAISSGLPANPGPQPGFDVKLPRFQGVVPFFEQITTGR